MGSPGGCPHRGHQGHTAMQLGECSEVAAIASRDPGKARTAASSLGVATAYEELLADPEVKSTAAGLLAAPPSAIPADP